jgi:hypothetical protein
MVIILDIIMKHLKRNKMKYLLSIFFFSLSISLYEHLIRDRIFDWVLSTGWTGAKHNAMNFWLDLFFGLNNNLILVPVTAILGYLFIRYIRVKKYFTKQHFTKYKHKYILALVIYHIVLTVLYYTESLVKALGLTLFARFGLNISLYKSLFDGYYGWWGLQIWLISLSLFTLFMIIVYKIIAWDMRHGISWEGQQWKTIHELQDRMNKQERELRNRYKD